MAVEGLSEPHASTAYSYREPFVVMYSWTGAGPHQFQCGRQAPRERGIELRSAIIKRETTNTWDERNSDCTMGELPPKLGVRASASTRS